jgi:hemerythrin-like domain-containing protein
MRATEVLMSEHRVIEQVLHCLEKMAGQFSAAKRIEEKPARDAIHFFRTFADRCHHGKEEGLLFPLLESKGFPREGGPTGVMLHEHDQGRALVRGMEEAVEAFKGGDGEAPQRFVDSARGYIDLLRAHIQKEDQILFQMADQAMSPAEQESLMASFDKVEDEEMGEGTHEAAHRIADELADRYGVPKVSAASESGGSHHTDAH